MSTPVRDLIDIPTQVLDGTFVLKLTQGVDPAHTAQTLRDYVVTRDLVAAFERALGVIAGAIDRNVSQATFLHGSFGSGKSHFMAVLHLLLQGDPQARAIPELAPVIARHDDVLAGKRYLLVPIHFLTARSMDAAILGQYVERVLRTDPGAGLPAVFLADLILAEELPALRARMGEATFLEGLNGSGGSEDEWGEFGTSWDTARVDAALASPANSSERRDLAAAYITTFRSQTAREATATGEGFVDLDNGLAAISAHAKQLGYDAVILFLDELILWLASSIGNLDFVQREAQKLTKLVEGTNANRPVPIVSFVARQRDLRELVGNTAVGAELQSFADTIAYQDGRFGRITLEDRDLPVIAKRRLLQPVSEAAAAELRAAVDRILAGRGEVVQTLLTSDADRDLFRMVYPFSPAVVQALIAVSEALQRERTALKVMVQLLVDHRDALEVGQLIPVGDLWDVVAAKDEPFSEQMRRTFDVAKRLYRTKFRPMLLGDHNLADPAPSDWRSNPAWKAFRADDRLIKTVLLSALVDKVEAFRNLDAGRLVALNWGNVTSPIPGRETQVVAAKLRNWAARAGELRVGDDPANPAVSIALVNVDTEAIIDDAIRAFDNAGTRRAKLRKLLDAELGNRLGAEATVQLTVPWRGTDRRIDVAFGNLRDAAEVPDAALRADGDIPKLLIDFPLDEHGRTPEDDLERLDRWTDAGNPATRTVCWLPSFFNSAGLEALRTYVALDELLLNQGRYEQHTPGLSQSQRLEARPVLENRRSQLAAQLRSALLSAYGVTSPGDPLLDPAQSLTEHFRSLDPAVTVRPTTEPAFAGAFDELVGQIYGALYPGHPKFAEKITRNQLQITWAEVARAIDADDGRVLVETGRRTAVRSVANPLGLGIMHESAFVVSTEWLQRLDRHLHAAREDGRPVTVADLRAWIDDAPPLSPRGLPAELADLVVLTVAAQTDHALVAGGRPFVPDVGKAMPGEVVLRPEQLPDAALWSTAVQRAQAIFGANASPRASAAEMNALAEKVRLAAGRYGRAPAELVAGLEDAGRKVGLDGDGGDRLRSARAAAALVAAVAVPDLAPVEVVRRLADAVIPTSDQAVAKSLSSASAVLAALADTRWPLLERGGPAVLEPMRTLLRTDEFACGANGYDKTRRALEDEALRIIGPGPVSPGRVPPGPVIGPPVTEPPVVPRPPSWRTTTVSSRPELDRLIYEKLSRLLEDGVEVTISWTDPE